MAKKLKQIICNHKETGPQGYVDRDEWAQKRIKAGWRQRQCPKCKLYVFWVKPSVNKIPYLKILKSSKKKSLKVYVGRKKIFDSNKKNNVAKKLIIK